MLMLQYVRGNWRKMFLCAKHSWQHQANKHPLIIILLSNQQNKSHCFFGLMLCNVAEHYSEIGSIHYNTVKHLSEIGIHLYIDVKHHSEIGSMLCNDAKHHSETGTLFCNDAKHNYEKTQQLF